MADSLFKIKFLCVLSSEIGFNLSAFRTLHKYTTFSGIILLCKLKLFTGASKESESIPVV